MALCFCVLNLLEMHIEAFTSEITWSLGFIFKYYRAKKPVQRKIDEWDKRTLVTVDLGNGYMEFIILVSQLVCLKFPPKKFLKIIASIYKNSRKRRLIYGNRKQISGVLGQGSSWEKLQKFLRKLWRLMGLLFILFVLMMVTQICSHVKSHRLVCFKHVLFLIHHLHLNKVKNKCEKIDTRQSIKSVSVWKKFLKLFYKR